MSNKQLLPLHKQYKKILVPLDGSELAELALVEACATTELSHAEITLLQVIVPIENVIFAHDYLPISIDERREARICRAQEYLDDVCGRMKCETITVHTSVEMGLVAKTIIDYAHEHSIDLIIMTTHCHSVLKRWVYGSVTNEVLSGTDILILVLRVRSKRKVTSLPESAQNYFKIDNAQ